MLNETHTNSYTGPRLMETIATRILLKVCSYAVARQWILIFLEQSRLKLLNFVIVWQYGEKRTRLRRYSGSIATEKNILLLYSKWLIARRYCKTFYTIYSRDIKGADSHLDTISLSSAVISYTSHPHNIIRLYINL